MKIKFFLISLIFAFAMISCQAVDSINNPSPPDRYPDGKVPEKIEKKEDPNLPKR